MIDAPVTTPLKRRRFPRLQFSLRTLVLAVLLTGSAGGLWWRWEPWVCDRSYPIKPSTDCGVSPNRRFAFIREPSQPLRVLNLETWSEDRLDIECTDDFVPTFSRDDECLITAVSREGTCWIDVYELAARRHILSFNSHLKTASFVSMSRDGKILLARGDRDGRKTLLVWDTVTARELLALRSADMTGAELPRDEKLVREIEEARQRRIARSLMIENLQEFAELARGRQYNDGLEIDAEFSPDGSLLWVLNEAAGKMQIWETATFSRRVQFDLPGTVGQLSERLVSPDNKILAFQGAGRTVHLYSTVTGEPISSVTLGPHCSGLISFSEDGALLMSRLVDGVEIHSAMTGQTLLRAGGPASIYRAQFSRDCQRLALTVNGEAWLVDVKSGKELFHLNTGAGVPIEPFFSKDGCSLLLETDSALLRLHRRRPEYWWGVAWLPEFWLTLLFAGAFVWSVVNDRRRFRALAATALDTPVDGRKAG